MTYFMLISICVPLILIAGIVCGVMHSNDTFGIVSLIALAVFLLGWNILYGLNSGITEVEYAEVINEARTKTYVAFQINTKTKVENISHGPDKIYIYEDTRFVNNKFEVKVSHFTNRYGFHTSSKVDINPVIKDTVDIGPVSEDTVNEEKGED